MKNHFELFGLTPAYALDLVHLDRAYRDIQANIHPDRFAHAAATPSAARHAPAAGLVIEIPKYTINYEREGGSRK